ncbi:MAG: ribonuclease J [bacterium]|nr:ribonuclease J [bacterium]
MAKKQALTVTFIGGLGEVGKNMMVFGCGEDMLIVDAGITFPRDEDPGVDIILPDFSFLHENRDRLRGLVITHGHEDHLGAVPYLLKEVRLPVYGTSLALGLLEDKLREQGVKLPRGSRTVTPGEKFRAACFEVETFRVNHSIADTVGLAIDSPAGLVVHSGDFKFDQTPVDGKVTDLGRLAGYAERGVLALLSDSTNAERPGYTPSERTVGRALDEICRHAQGRVLVTTFASNVHRIQQVLWAAGKADRKVAVVGRSIERTVEVASRLGYLEVPDGLMVEVEQANRLPAAGVVLMTTGSQGEPLSALSRMASGDHRRAEVRQGDTVVIAATPVPGNERLVARTVDQLFRRGAEVVYEAHRGVHVSGHGSREELKLMINLVRPKFFVPIHGAYRHLVRHAELACELGIPERNVQVAENGAVLEFTGDRVREAGRVPAENVMVDGLGVGDVGGVVIRDRLQLAQEGVVVVFLVLDRKTGTLAAGPDIISRGFVYMRESEELIGEARQKVAELLARLDGRDWAAVKGAVREGLGRFLFERTGRRPVLLPVILEVGDGQ